MPQDIFIHLGKCIRSARIENHLTQQELADQTGRGLRHIQNIEKGVINPSFEVLYSLIKRLGLSANILFEVEMDEQEIEMQHLLGKFASCNEEERKFVISVVDNMVEQFLVRKESKGTSASHSSN